MYSSQEIVFAVNPTNIPPLSGNFVLTFGGLSATVQLASDPLYPFASPPYQGNVEEGLRQIGLVSGTNVGVTLQNDRIVLAFSPPVDELVTVTSYVTTPQQVLITSVGAE